MDTLQKVEGPERGRGKAFCCEWSFWSLIAWNLAVIVWAVAADWSFNFLMAVYICQSLIIGLFWFIRVCELTDFDVQGHVEVSMEETFRAKSIAAVGFILTYGAFHLLALLSVAKAISAGKWPFLVMAAGFFASQWWSVTERPVWISDRRPALDIVLFPYVRILPMFVPLLFLVTGLGEKVPLVIFLIAKMLVDVGMQEFEDHHFGDLTHPEKLFTDYVVKKCELCRRSADSAGEPREMKGHVFCGDCYDRIKYAKEAADD